MNKKTVVFSTIIFSLFFTSLLISPEKAKAAIDQRCFTKQECIDAHEDAENPESFFYEGDDAKRVCGEQMYNSESGNKEPAGFCSPEGEAVTQVSFAGTKKFSNLGEFIKFLYQWSVSAGAILAVLVILVSGVQWAISMGKKEVIRKAKKRIAKAIAGLALIASSYLILNTINPALVNMRLPQAWMIKAETIKSLTCKDVEPAKTRIAKAGPTGKEDEWTKKEDISEGDWFKVETIEGEDKKTCGSSYHIEGGSGQQCQGVNCPGEKACLPFSVENAQINKSKAQCTSDKLTVFIKPTSWANSAQKMANNIPFSGFIREQPTTGNWLSADNAFIQPVCTNRKLGSPFQVSVDSEVIDKNESGKKVYPSGYLLKYPFKEIEQKVKEGCSKIYDKETKDPGFLIAHRANKQWAGVEPTLYITPSSQLANEGGSGQGKTGSINMFAKNWVNIRQSDGELNSSHLIPRDFSYFKTKTINENSVFVKISLSGQNIADIFSRFGNISLTGYLDYSGSLGSNCGIQGPAWFISTYEGVIGERLQELSSFFDKEGEAAGFEDCKPQDVDIYGNNNNNIKCFIEASFIYSSERRCLET